MKKKERYGDEEQDRQPCFPESPPEEEQRTECEKGGENLQKAEVERAGKLIIGQGDQLSPYHPVLVIGLKDQLQLLEASVRQDPLPEEIGKGIEIIKPGDILRVA